ncbi:DUF6924 domain-containing protein [Cryptosporangium phraense]|uniref:DUF6924 domain-containing protein n=1 Tax=Cryptosporangium phraense TaxID=2593070 RepID=A0A545ATT8_9ACTN|nr:hypothetical protein [Cryptosporangium phraense]TQS44748.1 hypothetical protein FL583_12340 [Cryptosporangium phraense]
MAALPVDKTLLIRVDYTDPAAWDALLSLVDGGVDSDTELRVVSDPSFDGTTPEDLEGQLGADPERTFAFLADTVTLASPERPVLVVDLDEDPGRAFRVVPAALPDVQSSLELGNRGFGELADAADEDGILRALS